MYTDTLLRVIIMSPLRWGWEIIQLSLLHYIQTSKFTDIDINIKRQKTRVVYRLKIKIGSSLAISCVEF